MFPINRQNVQWIAYYMRISVQLEHIVVRLHAVGEIFFWHECSGMYAALVYNLYLLPISWSLACRLVKVSKCYKICSAMIFNTKLFLLDFEDEVRRTFSGTMSIKNLDEKIV